MHRYLRHSSRSGFPWSVKQAPLAKAVLGMSALVCMCFGAPLAAVAAPATSQTSAAGTNGPSASHYAKTSPALVAQTRKQALKWAEETQRTIVPTLHLVETPHFLVFSAWNVYNDAFLADLCERMYAMLSQQFNVPATESVWIGKCPVYLFWDPSHYERFISEIDQSKIVDSAAAHANGYHANRGPFAYIVINGVSHFAPSLEQAKIRFYHVMVHEGTHAFLNRYISDEPMPLWVEEGVADYIAATLVPQSDANRTYVEATAAIVSKPEKVLHLLNKTKDLTPSEYGVAQSLVRWLVAQDRMAMIRFIADLKKGDEQEEALREAYHLTKQEFVARWAYSWQRMLAQGRTRDRR